MKAPWDYLVHLGGSASPCYNKSMDTTHFEERLKALPERPGVYLMRDAAGTLLYVGKAASLRNRVRSYFGAPAGLAPKTRRMVERVADFEVILTDSESEALILEANLIKRHRPRYNVRLKDDKAYPYLKINVQEEWAQVFITRRMEDDGARYFGPYSNTGAVRKTLDLVNKLFPYRSCTKVITGTDPRPCLDYHIGRCLGPCIGAVSKEAYGEVIRQVILFLEGKQEQVVKELRRQMEAAAGELAFERASALRDQVRAVERVTEHQRLMFTMAGDLDAIAFAQADDECCVQVFQLRGGKLFGREHFMLEGTRDEEPSRIMTSFVQQFYSSASYVPPTILLQHPVEDMEIVGQWLRSKRGGAVALRVPQRGERKRLITTVAENAAQTLQQARAKWLADTGKTAASLLELQEQLNLPRLPRRMECYDISDIQGTSAVGSMVVFEEGKPRPAHYRRFRIKSVHQNDDYGMMREVLRRRFRRSGLPAPQADLPGNGDSPSAAMASDEGQESQKVWEAPGASEEKGPWVIVPDLVLIDGGRGHLNAALEVMRDLGVYQIPTASLAKEREEVFLPEMAESILLPRTSQALYLLQRIRDEAHRFAVTYHRKVRSKKSTGSALDSITGVGPKRKRALLRRFGSVAAIKEASAEELAAVVGMTRALAQRLKQAL